MSQRLLTPSTLTFALLSLFYSSTYAQSTSPDVSQLSNIVVTATGFEQTISDAPATITVITKEELEGKAYRNVSDALQGIPGVSIEGGAGGKLETTNINIRGLSESYVLFLVDGKPLGASSEAYYNGFGGGALINLLPSMASIERIEVIRGPMSSLYGSSAMGGVINIITKKVASEWTGEFSLDGIFQQNSDSGNAYQGRYYLSGPLIQERLGLALYGSRFHRAEDKIINGYAKQRIYSTDARLDWKLNSAHSLRLEGGENATDNSRSEQSGSVSDMHNKRYHYAVTHDWNWGERNNTQSYYNNEEVKIKNGTNRSKYTASIINSKTIMPFNAHILTVGAEYKEEKTYHDARRFPGSKNVDLSRWQAAIFAEDELSLHEKLTLTGGLRLDKNQHFGHHITPRIYGIFHANDHLAIKGGVSGGYTTPNLKQTDDNIVEQAGRGTAWDQGNRDLKPESSTNYELGFAWETEQQISFSVMGYHTNFKDKIGKHDICNSPANAPNCHYNGEIRRRISQYINLDRARIQGVEAAFALPLGPVKIAVNYTLSHSKVTSGTSKGKALVNTPRHMFNVNADWNASEDLSIWGKLRYKSSSIDTGSSKIPHYTIVDTGLKTQLSKNINVFAGVYNAFNKKIDNGDYSKHLDGRRYFVGGTYQF